MTTRTTPWPSGTPSWTSLQTSDIPGAQKFYGAILGWDFTDPDPNYGGYTVGMRNGQMAAGISPPMAPGSPSAWGMFFASDDCDKTTNAIKENGGQVIVQPDEVGPLGRMSVAIDPTGAPFGVWQARQHIGAGIVNEPGGIAWEDLRSQDPDRARDFYAAVFGYIFDPMPEASPHYTLFANPAGEGPLGGIGPMFGADNQPSHWLVYFAVDNADDAVQSATENRGTVDSPIMDTPWGRMANLRGPEGERFSIIQLA